MTSDTPIDLSPWLQGRPFKDAWAQYEEEGFVILKDVMPPSEVDQVRTAITPYLTKSGRNNFEGFHSNRVYSLLAKAPEVFSNMITHPLALAFAERELGQSCLLSALLAINLQPGETVQDWHCDDDQIFIPRPRPAFGVSTFWAIDNMTETNGATEILPGSHSWSEDQRLPFIDMADVNDPRARDVNFDPHPQPGSIKAIVPSGSLMIAKGNLYHRGGANRSDKPRLIVTPQYCAGWARQLENMAMAVPKDIAATLPQRARELIGYNIHAAFMGYVDGVHPDRSLGIQE